MQKYISLIRLLIRLCLPGAVFIVVCSGLFMAFIAALGTITLTYRDPLFVGGAWLALLICYIIFGIVFTRFCARQLRDAFGSEAAGTRRRMAFLSGLPFYAMCLLFLMACIAGMLGPDTDMCASLLLIGIPGFFGFALVSGSYLLLLRLFSGRPVAVAHQ